MRPLPVHEANPAGAHHIQEQFLLRRTVFAPDQQFQQRTGETAAQTFQFPIRFLTVEHGIDRVQRPALIQHDPVPEQAIAVKHRSRVMQIP